MLGCVSVSMDFLMVYRVFANSVSITAFVIYLVYLSWTDISSAFFATVGRVWIRTSDHFFCFECLTHKCGYVKKWYHMLSFSRG